MYRYVLMFILMTIAVSGQAYDTANFTINQTTNEAIEGNGINESENFTLNPSEEAMLLETLEEYGIKVSGEAKKVPTFESPKEDTEEGFSWLFMAAILLIIVGTGGFFLVNSLPRFKHTQYDAVINYLRINIKNGYSKDALVAALKGKGWTEEEIEHCMKKI